MNKLCRAIGFVSREQMRGWANPSPFLPDFSFHEIHESIPFRARPVDILDAVVTLDIRNDRVADLLLSIRELPGNLLARMRQDRARLAARPFGLHSFTLLARTEREMSLGLAGRFWRPDLDVHPIGTAAEFQALDDPTSAMLVLRFEVIDAGGGLHTLRTETFVHCPNKRTYRLFTPYWLVIRLASGWIRRRTLSMIRRHAGRAHVLMSSQHFLWTSL